MSQRQGSQRKAVRNVRHALKRQGPERDRPRRGCLGPSSADAVRRFPSTNGWPAHGGGRPANLQDIGASGLSSRPCPWLLRLITRSAQEDGSSTPRFGASGPKGPGAPVPAAKKEGVRMISLTVKPHAAAGSGARRRPAVLGRVGVAAALWGAVCSVSRWLGWGGAARGAGGWGAKFGVADSGRVGVGVR